jgi:hypothetical protein
LFQQQPNGDFADATEQSGLSHISLPNTGFGVGPFDMENRGLLGLFSANGGVRVMTMQQGSGERFPYRERKLLLCNLGPGKGFQDVTASAGPDLQPLEASRAAAFDDVNNDGGVDILLTNNNGPARLLLNTVPDRGHWLLVHLEGVHKSVRLRKRGGTGAEEWYIGQALCERRRQLSRRQRSQSSLRVGKVAGYRPHSGPLAGWSLRGVAADGGGSDCESVRRRRQTVPLD